MRAPLVLRTALLAFCLARCNGEAAATPEPIVAPTDAEAPEPGDEAPAASPDVVVRDLFDAASPCSPSEAWCNNRCQDVSSDLRNCGGCGVVCPRGPAGTAPVCAEGLCVLRCAEGRGDCDDNPLNGCETDLRATSFHCGACGRACEAPTRCLDGVCAAP